MSADDELSSAGRRIMAHIKHRENGRLKMEDFRKLALPLVGEMSPQKARVDRVVVMIRADAMYEEGKLDSATYIALSAAFTSRIAAAAAPAAAAAAPAAPGVSGAEGGGAASACAEPAYGVGCDRCEEWAAAKKLNQAGNRRHLPLTQTIKKANARAPGP